jgi:polyhydroxybutyrate depolymerase
MMTFVSRSWLFGGIPLVLGVVLGCAAGTVSSEEGIASLPSVSKVSSARTSSDTASSPSLSPSERVTACTGKEAEPLDGTWTVAVGNDVRVFRVHVPASYDPTHATPVVLNFHGLGSDASQQEQLSGMIAKADREGFVAVHPEGLGAKQSWNAGECCGFASETKVDDIGFVIEMLDALESRLCVDSHRVFVTGMSNGAFFAQRVGCELASRVAAIAPVAGVLAEPTCEPSRAIPVIEFHGTLDPYVPYDGDAEIGLASVPATFAAWAERDGCSEALTQSYDDHDSFCWTHESCAAASAVTLCTVQGGGHTWPGGEPLPDLGYTTPYLSATDAMWMFFQAHPMSTPEVPIP